MFVRFLDVDSSVRCCREAAWVREAGGDNDQWHKLPRAGQANRPLLWGLSAHF